MNMRMKWKKMMGFLFNSKKLITRYIANRAFGSLREFSAIYQHRQIVDLAFKNE